VVVACLVGAGLFMAYLFLANRRDPAGSGGGGQAAIDERRAAPGGDEPIDAMRTW